MSRRRFREIKEETATQYTGVRKRVYQNEEILYIGRVQWREKGKIKGTSKEYPTEREAALMVDKVRISRGLEPINILKKKE